MLTGDRDMQCDNAGTRCQVKDFSIEDFAWSARLHMRKLPGDLAVLLGEKFLVEVLYPKAAVGACCSVSNVLGVRRNG